MYLTPEKFENTLKRHHTVLRVEILGNMIYNRFLYGTRYG